MTIAVDDHLTAPNHHAAMVADVRTGLTTRQKALPPKYFYDAKGSMLFDEITRLPEYYPTRTERSILTAHADEIAATTGAKALTELGSGTSEKTRLLLDALRRGGTLERFVPFDVDPTVLTASGEMIAAEYPGVEVQAVVGDFEQHIELLPRHDRRLIAFLGSTIGNLTPAARARFLTSVRATMTDGDTFLLGTDLVKSAERVVAAYDDAVGLTAQFNKNVLAALNSELGANFDLDAFDHVALWNAEAEWIEMRLRSRCDQRVRIGELGLEISFSRGEEILTEISAKFRRDGVERELTASGLRMIRWWTDPAGDFGLSLSTVA